MVEDYLSNTDNIICYNKQVLWDLVECSKQVVFGRLDERMTERDLMARGVYEVMLKTLAPSRRRMKLPYNANYNRHLSSQAVAIQSRLSAPV